MAKVPGYQIVLQLDTKKLVGYRTHSMDVEADMADSTTGASTNQWKENMPLFKGAEFSVGGLYDPATGGSVTTFDGAFSILAAWHESGRQVRKHHRRQQVLPGRRIHTPRPHRRTTRRPGQLHTRPCRNRKDNTRNCLTI